MYPWEETRRQRLGTKSVSAIRRGREEGGTLFENQNLRNRDCVFQDRAEAGRLLAEMLLPSVPPDGLVLAIPAGGVPVGLEIARKLDLPLDLLIVRKVQIPNNPEAGFGAVGPDGEVILNHDLLKKLRLTAEKIKEEVEKSKRVMEERNRIFRGGKPFPEVAGKTVILVDDGLASGFTMTEGVRFIQKRRTKSIIVAVPTAPKETLTRLLPMADEVYCLNVRSSFPFAVAEAYQKWYDLTDEEVTLRLEGRFSPPLE
jgi:putative phosphoribosyl transferase